MEQEKIKKDLNKLSRIETNKYCFDCSGSPALFAAIEEGIFLCLSCSGDHKGYCNPKKVKSITLDKWDAEEVDMMRFGGNRKLRCFLNRHPIPRGLSKKDVFLSKIMSYYREKLLCEATGKEFDLPLPVQGLKYMRDYDIGNTQKKMVLMPEIEDEEEEELPQEMKLFKGKSEGFNNNRLANLIQRQNERSMYSDDTLGAGANEDGSNERGSVMSSVWNYGKSVLTGTYNYVTSFYPFGGKGNKVNAEEDKARSEVLLYNENDDNHYH